MRYTYAISGLRRKRAHLMGEIEQVERGLAKLREQLAAVDATLRLFHPDADPNHITSIRPVWRGLWFRHGERSRLVLQALRDGGTPLPTSRVTEYLMRAKGLDLEDRAIRAEMREHARGALARHEARGNVRKIIAEPEVWWELVG